MDFDSEHLAFEKWASQMSDVSLDRHPEGSGHWSGKYRDQRVEAY